MKNRFQFRPLVIIIGAFLAYQNCAKVHFSTEQNMTVESSEIPVCSVEESTQCLIPHGYGIACVNIDNSVGSCRSLVCDPGYKLDESDNCVLSSCEPAMDPENACSSSLVVGYGQCAVSGKGVVGNSCVPLFCRKGQQEASNGNCPVSSCVEGASCKERNGSGAESCSSSEGTCVLNQCNEGFDLKAGVCIARTCAVGETKNCMTEWGPGTRKCSDKHFDMICEPLSCPAYFEIKTADHGYKICSPILCPKGREPSGACTVPTTTTTTTTLAPRPFSCRQYQAVSFPATIPARDSVTGICYYQKILSAVPAGMSGGTKLTSIFARSHDPVTYGQTLSPYILGQATPKFTLMGARNLKLSGAVQQLTSIQVDNFLVVGITNESRNQTTVQAYGTEDSAIIGTNGVKVNNQMIALTPFQSGGTATIDALLINKTFNPNENYLIDIKALDCGGSKELSDVYLVFE